MSNATYKQRQINPETEERTVFVGNLPSSTKKEVLKTLTTLFSQVGKVEAVKFRSAARTDFNTSKNVAVRMSTVEEAQSACSLNNKQVEDSTIRVVMALKDKSHDNRRAIFLGNLDSKTQEEDIRKLFSKCGEVDNMRLVKDANTGIGKGFAYVNFVSEDSVELAIRLNSHEVHGKKVRVARSVKKAKVIVDEKKKKGGKFQKDFGSNKKQLDRSQTYKKDKKGRTESEEKPQSNEKHCSYQSMYEKQQALWNSSSDKKHKKL